MIGNAAEAERYRRLADARREKQPSKTTGMGADTEPRSLGTERRGGSPESSR
jgi:hypothetical protein